ncbi:replication initiator protein RepSA [Streptomyces sp. H10-C2]|uniref:replication initiator protein RepSA n=1 Tax=unclassified Streptomyces TaxID=2593676 RepID=UPI0024B98EF8|nr:MULTISPECIES: replication initiator protein RepSA [unclassified Streptomyces]MDJ0346339.1 replication initiator protein RepSA [Streptomyces sp. PH10-H1]MDJ0370776.1 replication initiator protein RepSA [Streptomyces sp. H10-C2]
MGTDPLTLSDLLRVANDPGFERWQEQVKRTGGCAHPIHLRGGTMTKSAATGEILYAYSTEDEPGGRLRIACGNRRASRCPSCAWTYAGDVYHLIRAGLVGDDRMGVPATVRAHPRVFLTLTAPSFGPVHNRPQTGRCRCGAEHEESAAVLGTPLDVERYDYAGAVLWNNHAGQLWQRFTVYLRREIASRAGLSNRELGDYVRLSFAKVAEFQKRGAVHFHAIVRLDGPEGSTQEAPAWATAGLLDEAIRAAVRRVSLVVPPAGAHPQRVMAWGGQVDVRPIGAGEGGDLDDDAVSSYVAKYATKAAETTGAVDRRVGELSELDKQPDIPAHTRRLIEACWSLDEDYPERKLAHWSHMLGFRGHFSTKSRRYSSTMGARRQVRADFRARQERQERGLPDPGDSEETTLVVAHWEYAGQGHTPGESWLAQSIARDVALNRETAREARADIDTDGEW